MMTTVTEIQHRCAEYFGLTRADLLGRDRHKSVATARQLAMMLCRDELSLSYPEIGREFARDHTTCICGIASMRRQLERDVRLRYVHEQLKTPAVKFRVAV